MHGAGRHTAPAVTALAAAAPPSSSPAAPSSPSPAAPSAAPASPLILLNPHILVGPAGPRPQARPARARILLLRLLLVL